MRIATIVIALLFPLAAAADTSFMPASPFSLMARSHMASMQYLGSPFAEVSIFARTIRHAIDTAPQAAPPVIPADQPAQANTLEIAPSATIVVEPHVIRRGQSLVVSWTSEGASEAAPCILSDDEIVVHGNSGSLRLVLKSPQIYTFHLVCTSAQGETFSEKAVATVN